MAHVGVDRPDVLLLYSSAATDLPGIRKLVDDIHSQGVSPQMQIAVGGGVYDRASGLAEEIGADLYIPELEQTANLLINFADQRATADQRTVGRKRRLRSTAA